ncbi:glucokinase [Puia dinghuensis]|uniref:Glucokinase n=1 Tax=Puia dinghuensis TaxID=1792502 RepID=A0A8J2UFB8_9BACT|nr:glucokinase [Puia dinghuensis]GGB08973.1 glucokinase [Puia dinghuensis]
MSLKVPIAFKKGLKKDQEPVTLLAADIGGTKTNIARCVASWEGVSIVEQKRYVSRDYPTLTEIIHDFHKGKLPERVCAAVAGPVVNGRSKLTNLSWDLDSAAISRELGIPVHFINDLEATAYGMAGLGSDELATLATGDPEAKGNIAIIAPGTGLGEAGLFWDGERYHPFATEGGHADFAPRTPKDVELFYALQQQFGHVSWERLVSGMGIKNIFHCLVSKHRDPLPEWLSERLKDEDPAAVISEAALRHDDLICAETMDLFVRYLATEASCLVLKLMATGGLFLAGGIPPKILPLLQTEHWTKNFDNNGRMHDLSDKIPVHVVLNDKMALQGAAYYAAYNM